MDIERIAETDGRVSLWVFEWDASITPPVKANRQLLGYEQSARHSPENSGLNREAICWSYGRTLGNIAIFAEDILGSLSNGRCEDEILVCDIVEAGKMRNGAKRWWCRTHQRHWGTKADITKASKNGVVRCENHMQPMSYVIDPPSFNLEDYGAITIHCLLPPAISSDNSSKQQPPKLHVEAWKDLDKPKVVDAIFDALAVTYSPADDLFARSESRKIYITPPTAFDFVMGLEAGLEMDCINCRDCGYPHLDIGEFGRTPHSKHLCSNCGRDNTWSRRPIASTPLKPLHDRYNHPAPFIDAAGVLNIDDHECTDFEIRATLPAILWTTGRSQERGVHVRLRRNDENIIDKVFGTVIFDGRALQRTELLHQMKSQTIA